MIKATFDALQNLYAPRLIAAKRGKKVSEIFGRGPQADGQGDGDAAEAVATAE